jgi:hypothetical protein
MTASALPADFIRLAISGGDADPEASGDILSGVALEDIVETAESMDEFLGDVALTGSARDEAEDPGMAGVDLEEETPRAFWLMTESETLRVSFGGWRDEPDLLLWSAVPNFAPNAGSPVPAAAYLGLVGSGGSGVDAPVESLSLS